MKQATSEPKNQIVDGQVGSASYSSSESSTENSLVISSSGDVLAEETSNTRRRNRNAKRMDKSSDHVDKSPSVEKEVGGDIEPDPFAVGEDGLTNQEAAQRDILLGLPTPDKELVNAVESRISPSDLKALLSRVWEKRQEELRQVFDTTKTEAQLVNSILNDLLSGISSSTSTPLTYDDKVTLLTDIEFSVSQVHNAQDFVNMGGLPVMKALLNSTEGNKLPGYAAWIIGTTCKYEPDLQEKVVSAGIVSSLLHLGKDVLTKLGMNHDILAASKLGDSDPLLFNAGKLIYSFGCILRGSGGFKGAEQFVQDGGPRWILNYLNASQKLLSSSMHSSVDPKSKSTFVSSLSKLVQLLADLAEGADVELLSSGNKLENEKVVLQLHKEEAVHPEEVHFKKSLNKKPLWTLMGKDEKKQICESLALLEGLNEVGEFVKEQRKRVQAANECQ
jgi:hypothetical protein